MKGFRKSSKRGGNNHETLTVIGRGVVPSKSSLTIVPPKKVIRAIRDYVPQTSRELAFLKGDFFNVIGAENDRNWYEACNPAINMRGLVPVDYFEVLGKTVGTPTLNTSISVPTPPASATVPSGPKATPVYGVVQYDFVAEQKDELNVKAGESIIVIAQSNHEWFVCKPIGRLGGPGLIPISFIEIRDVATGKAIENIEEFVAKSGVPNSGRLEETEVGDYSSTSIPLGEFEGPPVGRNLRPLNHK